MVCIDYAKGAADSKVYLLKEFVTPQNTLMTRRSNLICVKRKTFKAIETIISATQQRL